MRTPAPIAQLRYFPALRPRQRVAIPALRIRLYTSPSTPPRLPPPSSSSSSPSSFSSSPSTPPNLPGTSLVTRYLSRLQLLSARTGVPLPSLAMSFLILHELTALLPILLAFWAFSILGTGAAAVEWLASVSASSGDQLKAGEQGMWDWRGVVVDWVGEAERRVERVGTRYGILGYAKGEAGRFAPDANGPAARDGKGAHGQERGEEMRELAVDARRSNRAAESVANAIAAYVLVKALLPLRIAVSVGAAPWFARFALYPFSNLVRRVRVLRQTGPPRPPSLKK